MALFAGTLTVALYIVTDMEYPRLGLIRIEAFDHFLADAYGKCSDNVLFVNKDVSIGRKFG
jgi:hypothetical protein